jgi:hypothetical protein
LFQLCFNEPLFQVEVDSEVAIDFNAFSPPYAGVYSSSKCSKSINPPDGKSSLDANAVPLLPPVSAIRRARGRPRRQEVNAPPEASAVEPVRKLRSKQNMHKTVSLDPWNNLSNSPLLTPLSPKKQRLEGTFRGLRQQQVKPINPSSPVLITDRISQGSASLRAVRFNKNNQVCLPSFAFFSTNRVFQGRAQHFSCHYSDREYRRYRSIFKYSKPVAKKRNFTEAKNQQREGNLCLRRTFPVYINHVLLQRLAFQTHRLERIGEQPT